MLQARLQWEGDISAEEVSKIQKCSQFWEVLKLFENWPHFIAIFKKKFTYHFNVFWTLSFFHGVHTIHNFQTYDLSFLICLIRKIFIFLITWFKSFLFLICPFRYHIPIPETNKITIRRNTCCQNTTK